MSSSLHGDARVDQRVDDVDDEIDGDEDKGGQHQIDHDHRTVAAIDRVDQKFAGARPGEDGLSDGGERDQVAELKAEDRDDRNERVLQAMTEQDDAAVRRP